MPVELSRTTLREMLDALPEGVETEIFAYGRMPLTLSARCFTARSHNLPKDDPIALKSGAMLEKIERLENIE